MQQQFLKPKMIQVPGSDEPVLARLTYPGTRRVLPAEGALRPKYGTEGGWWLRRIQEGAAEVVDPPKKTAKKTKKVED